jgi:hypothetical protein
MNRNARFTALTLAMTALPLLAGAVSRAYGQIGDSLPPSMGGLPAGAPARTTSQPPYPNVFDIPPPRSTRPLSKEEQAKLEAQLKATRARQLKLQDPGARARAENEEATSTAAMKKARAAAQDAQKKPSGTPAR